MSVASAGIQAPKTFFTKSFCTRIVVAVVAAGIVGLGLALLSYLVLATGVISAPPPRNPFATGAPSFAPNASGLGGFILVIQAQFFTALSAAVRTMKSDGTGILSLATIGFLYGIFHAAGPGHGKGVISGYVIASKSSIACGLVLSFAAALLQALVAIAVVAVFAVVLTASATTINAAARSIELASFAGVAIMGAVLVWVKAGEFVRLLNASRGDGTYQADDSPARFGARNDLIGDWRVFAGVVLAAGIRPCSGAIILLVFSLSQGLFIAGVLGALAMACGTSITTGTMASAAVFAKTLAQRVTAGRGTAWPFTFAGFELLAAAFVLILGTVLLAGVWAGGMLSALD